MPIDFGALRTLTANREIVPAVILPRHISLRTKRPLIKLKIRSRYWTFEIRSKSPNLAGAYLRVCVCTCVCVCVYVCARACMCLYVFVFTCIRADRRVCACVCLLVCVCACVMKPSIFDFILYAHQNHSNRAVKKQRTVKTLVKHDL